MQTARCFGLTGPSSGRRLRAQ